MPVGKTRQERTSSAQELGHPPGGDAGKPHRAARLQCARALQGGRRHDKIGARGRPPLAVIAAGSSRSVAQPGDSGFAGKAALGLVGLGVVGHVLRSRRFYERVIVGAIVLGALRGLGQENRASTFERLAAWNRRQVQVLERRAERQARRLERKAERHARRLAARAKLRIRKPRARATDRQLAAGAAEPSG